MLVDINIPKEKKREERNNLCKSALLMFDFEQSQETQGSQIQNVITFHDAMLCQIVMYVHAVKAPVFGTLNSAISNFQT